MILWLLVFSWLSKDNIWPHIATNSGLSAFYELDQSASGQICWPYGFPEPKANNVFKEEITGTAKNTDFDPQVLSIYI